MQVVIDALLTEKLETTRSMDAGTSAAVVVLVCLFVANFAWSWWPLHWLIPSETFPIETRTTGFTFTVSSNMFFIFVRCFCQ